MNKPLLYTLIVFTLLSTSSCSNEEPAITSPLQGEWTITEASKDNDIQADWHGKVVTFVPASADAGTYSFSSTVDESIWKSTGNWQLTDLPGAQLLTINDAVPITYVITDNNSKLSLEFLLDEVETCETFPCLPVVHGHWNFLLQRTN